LTLARINDDSNNNSSKASLTTTAISTRIAMTINLKTMTVTGMIYSTNSNNKLVPTGNKKIRQSTSFCIGIMMAATAAVAIQVRM